MKKPYTDWEFYDFTLDPAKQLKPVFFIRQYSDRHYYKFILDYDMQKYKRFKCSVEELKIYMKQSKLLCVSNLQKNQLCYRFNIGDCDYGF